LRASSQNVTVLAKVTVNTRCASAVSCSRRSCVANCAAVTTMMSREPSAASASCSAASNVSGRSRSQSATPTSWPAVLRDIRSAALRRSSSRSRPSRNRRSPRSAIRRARARPMPFVAPSMTTCAGRFTIQRAVQTVRFECVPRDPISAERRERHRVVVPSRESARDV